MLLPFRVRISVRVLMVLVLLVGGWLGWIVHRARVQRDAVAAIERGGGDVYYDWQVKYVRGANPYRLNRNGKPRWPKWLVDHLGPDYFGDVKMVGLGGNVKDADVLLASVGELRRLGDLHLTSSRTKLTDAGLAHLRGLGQLEVISCNPMITGTGLAMLKDLKQLRTLELLNAGNLGDADLIHLKELTALEYLALRRARITSAGLIHLRDLSRMNRLDLRSTTVTPAGLGHLRAMTRLQYLVLAGTPVEDLSPIRHLNGLTSLDAAHAPVTDAGLAALEGLSELQVLDLSSTQVTDAGLEHLRGLRKLRVLRVGNTRVDDQGFAELQRVLPSLSKPPAPPKATPARLRPKAKAQNSAVGRDESPARIAERFRRR